jgi:formylglycine-generating enzyme required for sulfatase activity
MCVAHKQKLLAGIGFALTLLGILLGSLTMPSVAHAQKTNQREQETLVEVGRLIITDSTETPAGAFQLTLTQLAPAPAGSHYELWLHSDQTDTLALGPITHTVDGKGTAKGTLERNLLAYDQASVSLEADNDDDATISDQIILTATLPKPLYALLAQLLLPGELTAEGNATSGFITAAQGQAQVAIQHTGFLRDALSEADLPLAHRHTEHIINILDGKNGFMFGDLDRNGRTENPGDGSGVRSYLDEANTRALALAELTGTDAASSDLETNAQSIIATLDDAQTFVSSSFDNALQIFASDTMTEANTHAQDLALGIDELTQKIATAYALSLQMAVYTFYGPTVIAPPIPPTPTQTATHTPSPSATASATSTPSPTQRPPTPTRPPTLSPTATRALSLPPTTTVTTTITASGTITLVPTQAAAATQRSTVARPTVAPLLPGLQLSITVGQSWRNPVDSALYIYVPGEEFVMGSTTADAASPREEPEHTVTVAEFWVQQTETTNGQYARCVAAGVCSEPKNERWHDPAYIAHPVTDIDWQQANSYAAWVGGRLPTEAEWEKACRSTDARPFPWGNEPPTATRSNYNNAVGDTMPVGSYPEGASPLGIVDLSGNVWEWINSLDAAYPYSATDGREDPEDPGKRVVRGGSFYYTQYQIRCAARTGFTPDTASQHIGLRVVIDKPTNEWRHAVDEALYVYVSGGEFEMGSPAEEAASPREAPRHTAAVADFWIQQTETTNAQYARCVTAGVCTEPDNERWHDPAYAEHPVANVDWQQANSYAAWVGGRLPTEAEWEKACRSSDARTFPWGEEPPSATLSNYNNLVGDTAPVGSYPDGASPVGALDLSGNLWEWVSTLDADYPYSATDGREDANATGKRIVRGGSFYYTQYQIRCAARTGFPADTISQHIGFRVVLAAPQSQE